MNKIKFLLIPLLLCQINTLEANIIDINTAIAFQNEGTLTADHTNLLKHFDGNLGSATGGSVAFDYYATGPSQGWFDALSINFDLSSIGYANITNASLKFYVEKGDYGDTSWQHYQVLEGAFNPINEDLFPPSGVAGLVDFGGGVNIISNTTIGWIDSSLDLSWITSNNFDVTLRLWNARIDRIELQVDTSPVPATVWLFGSGLIGLIGMRKKPVKLLGKYA